MKLYVWHDALSDNTPGVMFALASSIDEARALILAKITDEWELHSVAQAVVAEPTAYDTPVGFFLFGGG